MKCVPCVSGAHGPAGQGCSLRARLAHLTLLSPSTRVEEAAEHPPCIECTAELRASRLWDIVASSREAREAISSMSTRCMCAIRYTRGARATACQSKKTNPDCHMISDQAVPSKKVSSKNVQIWINFTIRRGFFGLGPSPQDRTMSARATVDAPRVPRVILRLRCRVCWHEPAGAILALLALTEVA